eukprot:4857600-Pyramimonas_sp.AAC.1
MRQDNGRGKAPDNVQEDEFSRKDRCPIPAQTRMLKGYAISDLGARKEAMNLAVNLREENANEFDAKETHPPASHGANE